MTEALPVVVTDRRMFVGGSDIASVIGVSPWRSIVELWAQKTAPEQKHSPTTGVKRRGKRWEATVGEMLIERLESEGHKISAISTNRQVVDPDVNYFACEIDFEVILDDDTEVTNVELKTVHPFKTGEWGESGTDEAPIWYTAQAMWGLGITRRKRCLVAPLFGADELRVFPVEADQITIAALRQRASDFWNDHVLTGIPPEPTSLDDLALLFPKDIEANPMVADEDLTGVLLRMRALSREMKAREGEWDSLEYMVKRIMGATTQVNIGDKAAVSWKERDNAHLDFERLKADHPKIYKEYTKRGNSRVFTLKPFAWKE